jgi:hypothetical protein
MKNIFLILVLAFFVAEYLNPSSVGVRACCDPGAAGSPADSNGQGSSGSESHASIPHFMIQPEAYALADNLPSEDLFSSFSALTKQNILKEIFHPPLNPVETHS